MAEPLAHAVSAARSDAARGAREALESVNDLLDLKLIHAGGIDLTIGAVLAAILAVLLTWLLSRLVRRGFDRYAARHGSLNRASIYTVSRVVHYTILTVGIVLALDLAGIPVSKFAVFAGALGVGLGFGLQAIFNNFVSGLILLFERSLKVGDFVELASGVHGEVRDIHIRATRITTNDNIDILIPNSEFVNGRVVNWTLRAVPRRQKIPFPVAYDSDKDLVKTAALEAAAAVPFTLTLEGQHRPQVWLTSFGESALQFALVVWLTADATKRPGAVAAAYNWELATALAKYGIETPLPQRDLRVRSWFGLEDEDARADFRNERARPSPTPEAARATPSSENDAAREVQSAARPPVAEIRLGDDAPPSENDDTPRAPNDGVRTSRE